MKFKTGCQLLHRTVQARSFRTEFRLIAICFVLRQANDLTISKFAQKGNVSFANSRSQISIAGQRLGLRQQICRG